MCPDSLFSGSHALIYTGTNKREYKVKGKEKTKSLTGGARGAVPSFDLSACLSVSAREWGAERRETEMANLGM